MLYGKKIIALCTSRVYDAGHHRFIRVLNDNISKFGYRLFIYTLNTDLYWNDEAFCAETKVYDLIPFDKIEGVIVMCEKIKSAKLTDMIAQRARAAGIPMIAVDGKLDGAVSVWFDYEKGFEKIVRHVVEEHHVRRPHFMAGIKGNMFSESRLKIFKKVIAENNIEFDEKTMLSYGEFWAKPSRLAAEELCARDELPEAVICANDVMAINVNDVFHDNGVKVPEDVIITGFDGIDEVQYCVPKIATVSVDWVILADAVSKVVFDYSAGSVKAGDIVEVMPELIPNESCGCASASDNKDRYISKINDSFYEYQDDVRGLYVISMKMQMSASPEDAVKCMQEYLLHDMCVIARSEIFEPGHNFLKEELPPGRLKLIYDSYHYDRPIRDFDLDEIVPDLEEKLECHAPLIFNGLDFMNKSLGFICYSFKNYDITDYTKTAQINNTVSMGLGGYINMQYQEYLAKQVEKIYKNDQLTGLYTRTGFMRYFEDMVKENIGKGGNITVVMSDMNGLKTINDTYGHSAGDIAIRAVARALRASCPDSSVCVRYGGDEMVAIISEDVDPDKIISDIDECLDRFNSDSGLMFKVSTSTGVFVEPLTDSFDLGYAVKRADRNMYETKKIKKSAMK